MVIFSIIATTLAAASGEAIFLELTPRSSYLSGSASQALRRLARASGVKFRSLRISAPPEAASHAALSS